MPWKDIFGQEFAKRVLQNSLRMGRVHHAYLFYGPDGVGKRLTSKVFAQAINCETLKWDGCGTCPQCHLIQVETHPDVLILDPSGDSFSIDEIRRLKKGIYYGPVMGRWKVYILVGVERMDLSGMNSLLIILEDPPKNTVFVLTTAEKTLLPSTILSRCQPIPFRPIPRSLVVSLLIGWGLSEGKANHLALLSDGIPERAKGFMEEDLFKKEEEVSSWLKEINLGRPIDLIELSKEISSMERGKILRLLDILLYKLKGLLDGRVLLMAMEIVHKTQSRIQAYGNPQLSLEVMFLQLYKLRGYRDA